MNLTKVQNLIVDSGAFIKNSPVHEFGENIFTTHGVVKEIKDKATRQRLGFLLYELKFQEPSQDIIKYVTEFSKKTGDYPSLSAVDIQIIALTYQLEKEHNGSDHLNKEPAPGKITSHPAHVSDCLAGFYYPDKEDKSVFEDPDIEDEGKGSSDDELEQNNVPAEEAEPNLDLVIGDNEQRESEEDVCSGDDDDDDTWITPFNIKEMKQKMGVMSVSDETRSTTVACITTDFAVQNVLLQIGLNVVSVDGMLIKHAKVFILRCYACYRTTSIMTKQFCPGCGNKTLKRVAVSINDDGSKKIQINFKKPINIRGTKYSLPMPRAGRHAENPILCEDQPFTKNKLPKSALTKLDMFSQDYEVQSSPFTVNDVYSRAAQLGIRRQKMAATRRNPNESAKRIRKKK